MIRNPRQQRAGTARGRILLAALIAAAVLGLGVQPAMALVPNDEFFSKQWGDYNTGQLIPTQNSEEKLGSEVKGTPGADDRVAEAWGVTTGSRSIVIAETDTGVDYEHPDLKTNIWTNPGAVGGCPEGTHGFNVVSEPEKKCEPLDEEPSGGKNYGGHGTHVAGIMGAVGNNGEGVAGMNWQTSILPVKWLSSASGAANSTENLVKALEAVVAAKNAGVNIRVVNDSPTFVGTPYSPALSREIDVLAENNILFVTAAGNTGENIDEEKAVRYPCGYDGPMSGPKGEPPHPRPNEICVTATDNKDQLPTWADYGPSTVDLAAPGQSVYSTLRGGNYGYLSGGSMAAAQVSGAAALILSVRPALTAAELKTEILKSVDKLPSLKGKVRTEGRLDVAKALPGAVTSVSPSSGSTGGGTSVTITGANLTGATAVTFGASEATQIKVNSATSITATSPAGIGTVNVTVTTPSGTSATSANDRFAYATEVPPTPTVTSVSPSNGPTGGGTSVTVTGANLTGATAVKFGTTNATSFTMNTPTSITATSPAGTGTVDVTVTTLGGTSSTNAADQFTYAPAVTSMSPSTGPGGGGTPVTITGSSLANASAVKFGTTNATSLTKNSPTSITATSPAGTGTVDVTVTTPGGTSPPNAADQFTYSPAVTSVSPSSGPGGGGTAVTITGTSLANASAVKFGTTNASSFANNSPTSITATSPAGTGTVEVTVTTPGGTSPTNAADQFTYAPAVTGVSPSSGPTSGGTSVTITGSSLANASAVKFGATNAASFTNNSPTSITATSPAGVGTVDVTVATPGGTSPTIAADQFTYAAEMPQLNTLPAGTPSASAGQSSVLGTTISSSSVVLPTSALTVRHDRTAIKLRCVGSATCRGTLTITVRLAVHRQGKPTRTRVLSIGRAGFSLGAGQTASIAVTLTAVERRLLSAAHGHLDALLTILQSAAGPSGGQLEHVRLRASGP